MEDRQARRLAHHGVVATTHGTPTIDTALGLFLQTKDVSEAPEVACASAANEHGVGATAPEGDCADATGEEAVRSWGPGLLLVSPSIILIAVFVYGLIGWNIKVSLERLATRRSSHDGLASGLAVYR